jgi:hypothetical protein
MVAPPEKPHMPTESSVEELASRLASYPKEALPFFNRGFAVAGKISEEARKLVLQELLANFRRGARTVRPSIFRSITELHRGDAELLASVYSVVIGLLSDTRSKPEEFVSSAKGVLFEPPHEAAARWIAESVHAYREDIRAAVSTAQLAGEVLPSLNEFEVAVDLRVRVAEGKITAGVPVALLFIDTDAHFLRFCEKGHGEFKRLK